MNDYAVDVRELSRDSSEIVPHAGKNFLDLLGRFFGKCSTQILPPDFVFGKPRADEPHQPPEYIGHTPAIDPAQYRKRANNDPTQNAIECALEGQQERERFAPARHRGSRTSR